MAEPPQSARSEPPLIVAAARPARTPTLLAFVLLSLLALFSGYALFVSAKQSVTRGTQDELATIAKLKASHIERWLAEHRKNLQANLGTPLFRDELRHWLAAGRPADARQARLLAQLHQLVLASQIDNISIFAAADGGLLLSTGNHPDTTALRGQVMDAARRKQLAIEDFHLSESGGGTAHFDIGLFGPIDEPGRQAEFVGHLTLDPDVLLFPLLKEWPGTSTTAETLLLRRDGEDALFLTPLRHLPDAPMQLRKPVRAPDFVGGLAALGAKGALEGLDYRGEPVLAHALPIAGTPWILIAKIDEAEIYAQHHQRTVLAVLVVALLLLAAAWWLAERGRHLAANHRAELEHARLSKRLDYLARYANDCVILFDPDGFILDVNDRCTANYGFERNELLGMNVADLRPLPFRGDVSGLLRDIVTEGSLLFASEHCRRDGSIFPVEVSARLIDAEGERHIQAIVRDISERVEAERALQKLNRALRLLSECSAAMVRAKDERRLLDDICAEVVSTGGYRMAWVGFAEHDAARTIRPVAAAGIGSARLDEIRVSWGDDKHGRGPAGTAIRTCATQINQDFANDPRMAPWRKIALEIGYHSSISLPLAKDSQAFGILTIYSEDARAFHAEEVKLLEELAADLSYGIATLRTRFERESAEEKLAFLAHHDALTHLPNRLLLRDRFDHAVAIAEREGSGVALLYLDMDHFKQINDSLGHEMGDKLLIEAVARLQGCIRDTDTVSRQGGDEFIVLLPNVDDPLVVGRIAQQIIEAFKEPIPLAGNEIVVSYSIGIALYPADAGDFDELLRKADTALYHAKDSGRNACHFFTEQMNVDTLERLQRQNQLRLALKNDEFVLHYQPQIAIADGRLVGVEALLRWQRPEEGMIAPASFIPLAEQSGLIVPIGAWVIREACRQAQAWRDAGYPALVVAVNLSALQFKRGDILDTVTLALGETGLPAACLELELTESILLQDTELAMLMMHRLKEIGVKLSIDDFGTGYSSLSYLKRLAVDKLKVDQSFVRDLGVDAEDSVIVKAIVQLGHSLQLSVIAEGVENDAQLAQLRAYGCDEAQGYLFSRPLPAEECGRLLAGRAVLS